MSQAGFFWKQTLSQSSHGRYSHGAKRVKGKGRQPGWAGDASGPQSLQAPQGDPGVGSLVRKVRAEQTQALSEHLT